MFIDVGLLFVANKIVSCNLCLAEDHIIIRYILATGLTYPDVGTVCEPCSFFAVIVSLSNKTIYPIGMLDLAGRVAGQARIVKAVGCDNFIAHTTGIICKYNIAAC